jgi:phage baseplate assembly protein W
VQLLTLKFGPLPHAVLHTVQAASIEQVEAWTARVLTTETLNEVLS